MTLPYTLDEVHTREITHVKTIGRPNLAQLGCHAGAESFPATARRRHS